MARRIILVLLVLTCCGTDGTDLLKSRDPHQRKIGVQRLGASASPEATRSLVMILNSDPDEWVRAEAALALGNVRTPEATLELVRKAQSQDLALVRVASLTAIERSRDPRAIPGLIAIWDLERSGDDYGAHTGAAVALQKIGPPSIEPLLQIALSGRETHHRRLMAIDTLAGLHVPDLERRLAPLVEDPNPSIRFAVQRALDSAAGSAQ